MAVDIPVAVSATLVFSPIEAGILGFVSAFDVKELRRRITPTKAIFNRSQTGLTYFAASLSAHALTSNPVDSPHVILLAIFALASFTIVNYAIVSSALSIEHKRPISQIVSKMRVGTPSDFVLSSITWAVLGAMLTVLYERVGAWALPAFLGPILISRQALVSSQMVIDTSRAYRSREAALEQLAGHVYEERRDERRLIAADLHDEVLQPLFKVTLMAQVIKADLAGGRLLELDQDLPELMTAAEIASSTLRDLIGDLRRSSLGRGGLAPAIRRLTDGIGAPGLQLHTQVEPVLLPPAAELAAYQIAKEAFGNALAHSRASDIWVTLKKIPQDESVVLEISDNGLGFDIGLDRTDHFGIQIMKERASAVGASLYLDSSPSGGTRVVLVVNRTEALG
jgi:signal transduction histidine kinase